ncbi:MAG TPA: VOC family protein [Puia sp.]|jgi:uncharacterized glyoxalase superfamily protein PhnB|nr:VOC family protein [Puia sp.]
MEFQKLTPMLSTNQLKETIDFYTNKLGFSLVAGDELGWAAIQRGNVELMFTLPNQHIPFDKPVYTGSFYINVDDVDQIWTELKDVVKIVYDIENFDYGMREFAIYDNNGYIIQFGQDIGEIDN